MSFAPAYISNVLSENFEDAKVLFFSPLMSIHYAHLVMLARTGIISADDARVVRDALDAIPPDAVRAAIPHARYFDSARIILVESQPVCGSMSSMVPKVAPSNERAQSRISVRISSKDLTGEIASTICFTALTML